MPVLTPHVPDGLIDLMKALTKSILKEKPDKIYEFAVEHFEKLVTERDGSLDKGYERFRSEETYFQSLEKYEKVKLKYQRMQLRTTEKQNLLNAKIDINEKSFGESVQATPQPVQRKFKTRKLSSRKPSEILIAIKEEDDEEAVRNELDNEMQRRHRAAFQIQKAFRRFRGGMKASDGGGGKVKMTEQVAALIIQRALKTIFTRKLAAKEEKGISNEKDLEDVKKVLVDSGIRSFDLETIVDNETIDSEEMKSAHHGLKTPLRQNSDDQHPSLAFGERCSENEVSQTTLASTLLSDSIIGDEVDAPQKSSEVKPLEENHTITDKITEESNSKQPLISISTEQDSLLKLLKDEKSEKKASDKQSGQESNEQEVENDDIGKSQSDQLKEEPELKVSGENAVEINKENQVTENVAETINKPPLMSDTKQLSSTNNDSSNLSDSPQEAMTQLQSVTKSHIDDTSQSKGSKIEKVNLSNCEIKNQDHLQPDIEDQIANEPKKLKSDSSDSRIKQSRISPTDVKDLNMEGDSLMKESTKELNQADDIANNKIKSETDVPFEHIVTEAETAIIKQGSSESLPTEQASLALLLESAKQASENNNAAAENHNKKDHEVNGGDLNLAEPLNQDSFNVDNPVATENLSENDAGIKLAHEIDVDTAKIEQQSNELPLSAFNQSVDETALMPVNEKTSIETEIISTEKESLIQVLKDEKLLDASNPVSTKTIEQEPSDAKVTNAEPETNKKQAISPIETGQVYQKDENESQPELEKSLDEHQRENTVGTPDSVGDANIENKVSSSFIETMSDQEILKSETIKNIEEDEKITSEERKTVAPKEQVTVNIPQMTASSHAIQEDNATQNGSTSEKNGDGLELASSLSNSTPGTIAKENGKLSLQISTDSNHQTMANQSDKVIESQLADQIKEVNEEESSNEKESLVKLLSNEKATMSPKSLDIKSGAKDLQDVPKELSNNGVTINELKLDSQNMENDLKKEAVDIVGHIERELQSRDLLLQPHAGDQSGSNIISQNNGYGLEEPPVSSLEQEKKTVATSGMEVLKEIRPEISVDEPISNTDKPLIESSKEAAEASEDSLRDRNIENINTVPPTENDELSSELKDKSEIENNPGLLKKDSETAQKPTMQFTEDLQLVREILNSETPTKPQIEESKIGEPANQVSKQLITEKTSIPDEAAKEEPSHIDSQIESKRTEIPGQPLKVEQISEILEVDSLDSTKPPSNFASPIPKEDEEVETQNQNKDLNVTNIDQSSHIIEDVVDNKGGQLNQSKNDVGAGFNNLDSVSLLDKSGDQKLQAVEEENEASTSIDDAAETAVNSVPNYEAEHDSLIKSLNDFKNKTESLVNLKNMVGSTNRNEAEMNHEILEESLNADTSKADITEIMRDEAPCSQQDEIKSGKLNTHNNALSNVQSEDVVAVEENKTPGSTGHGLEAEKHDGNSNLGTSLPEELFGITESKLESIQENVDELSINDSETGQSGNHDSPIDQQLDKTKDDGIPSTTEQAMISGKPDDYKEKEASSPISINQMQQSNDNEVKVVTDKGKEYDIHRNDLDTVDVKSSVDGISDASIIGKQLVETSNDVDMYNEMNNGDADCDRSNSVPDFECDIKNKEKACDDAASKNIMNTNEDSSKMPDDLAQNECINLNEENYNKNMFVDMNNENVNSDDKDGKLPEKDVDNEDQTEVVVCSDDLSKDVITKSDVKDDGVSRSKKSKNNLKRELGEIEVNLGMPETTADTAEHTEDLRTELILEQTGQSKLRNIPTNTKLQDSSSTIMHAVDDDATATQHSIKTDAGQRKRIENDVKSLEGENFQHAKDDDMTDLNFANLHSVDRFPSEVIDNVNDHQQDNALVEIEAQIIKNDEQHTNAESNEEGKSLLESHVKHEREVLPLDTGNGEVDASVGAEAKSEENVTVKPIQKGDEISADSAIVYEIQSTDETRPLADEHMAEARIIEDENNMQTNKASEMTAQANGEIEKLDNIASQPESSDPESDKNTLDQFISEDGFETKMSNEAKRSDETVQENHQIVGKTKNTTIDEPDSIQTLCFGDSGEPTNRLEENGNPLSKDCIHSASNGTSVIPDSISLHQTIDDNEVNEVVSIEKSANQVDLNRSSENVSDASKVDSENSNQYSNPIPQTQAIIEAEQEPKNVLGALKDVVSAASSGSISSKVSQNSPKQRDLPNKNSKTKAEEEENHGLQITSEQNESDDAGNQSIIVSKTDSKSNQNQEVSHHSLEDLSYLEIFLTSERNTYAEPSVLNVAIADIKPDQPLFFNADSNSMNQSRTTIPAEVENESMDYQSQQINPANCISDSQITTVNKSTSSHNVEPPMSDPTEKILKNTSNIEEEQYEKQTMQNTASNNSSTHSMALDMKENLSEEAIHEEIQTKTVKVDEHGSSSNILKTSYPSESTEKNNEIINTHAEVQLPERNEKATGHRRKRSVFEKSFDKDEIEKIIFRNTVDRVKSDPCLIDSNILSQPIQNEEAQSNPIENIDDITKSEIMEPDFTEIVLEQNNSKLSPEMEKEEEESKDGLVDAQNVICDHYGPGDTEANDNLNSDQVHAVKPLNTAGNNDSESSYKERVESSDLQKDQPEHEKQLDDVKESTDSNEKDASELSNRSSAKSEHQTEGSVDKVQEPDIEKCTQHENQMLPDKSSEQCLNEVCLQNEIGDNSGKETKNSYLEAQVVSNSDKPSPKKDSTHVRNLKEVAQLPSSKEEQGNKAKIDEEKEATSQQDGEKTTTAISTVTMDAFTPGTCVDEIVSKTQKNSQGTPSQESANILISAVDEPSSVSKENTGANLLIGQPNEYKFDRGNMIPTRDTDSTTHVSDKGDETALGMAKSDFPNVDASIETKIYKNRFLENPKSGPAGDSQDQHYLSSLMEVKLSEEPLDETSGSSVTMFPQLEKESTQEFNMSNKFSEKDSQEYPSKLKQTSDSINQENILYSPVEESVASKEHNVDQAQTSTDSPLNNTHVPEDLQPEVSESSEKHLKRVSAIKSFIKGVQGRLKDFVSNKERAEKGSAEKDSIEQESNEKDSSKVYPNAPTVLMETSLIKREHALSEAMKDNQLHALKDDVGLNIAETTSSTMAAEISIYDTQDRDPNEIVLETSSGSTAKADDSIINKKKISALESGKPAEAGSLQLSDDKNIKPSLADLTSDLCKEKSNVRKVGFSADIPESYLDENMNSNWRKNCPRPDTPASLTPEETLVYEMQSESPSVIDKQSEDSIEPTVINYQFKHSTEDPQASDLLMDVFLVDRFLKAERDTYIEPKISQVSDGRAIQERVLATVEKSPISIPSESRTKSKMGDGQVEDKEVQDGNDQHNVAVNPQSELRKDLGATTYTQHMQQTSASMDSLETVNAVSLADEKGVDAPNVAELKNQTPEATFDSTINPILNKNESGMAEDSTENDIKSSNQIKSKEKQMKTLSALRSVDSTSKNIKPEKIIPKSSADNVTNNHSIGSEISFQPLDKQVKGKPKITSKNAKKSDKKVRAPKPSTFKEMNDRTKSIKSKEKSTTKDTEDLASNCGNLDSKEVDTSSTESTLNDSFELAGGIQNLKSDSMKITSFIPLIQTNIDSMTYTCKDETAQDTKDRLSTFDGPEKDVPFKAKDEAEASDDSEFLLKTERKSSDLQASAAESNDIKNEENSHRAGSSVNIQKLNPFVLENENVPSNQTSHQEAFNLVNSNTDLSNPKMEQENTEHNSENHNNVEIKSDNDQATKQQQSSYEDQSGNESIIEKTLLVAERKTSVENISKKIDLLRKEYVKDENSKKMHTEDLTTSVDSQETLAVPAINVNDSKIKPENDNDFKTDVEISGVSPDTNGNDSSKLNSLENVHDSERIPYESEESTREAHELHSSDDHINPTLLDPNEDRYNKFMILSEDATAKSSKESAESKHDRIASDEQVSLALSTEERPLQNARDTIISKSTSETVEAPATTIQSLNDIEKIISEYNRKITLEFLTREQKLSGTKPVNSKASENDSTIVDQQGHPGGRINSPTSNKDSPVSKNQEVQEPITARAHHSKHLIGDQTSATDNESASKKNEEDTLATDKGDQKRAESSRTHASKDKDSDLLVEYISRQITKEFLATERKLYGPKSVFTQKPALSEPAQKSSLLESISPSHASTVSQNLESIEPAVSQATNNLQLVQNKLHSEQNVLILGENEVANSETTKNEQNIDGNSKDEDLELTTELANMKISKEFLDTERQFYDMSQNSASMQFHENAKAKASNNTETPVSPLEDKFSPKEQNCTKSQGDSSSSHDNSALSMQNKLKEPMSLETSKVINFVETKLQNDKSEVPLPTKEVTDPEVSGDKLQDISLDEITNTELIATSSLTAFSAHKDQVDDMHQDKIISVAQQDDIQQSNADFVLGTTKTSDDTASGNLGCENIIDSAIRNDINIPDGNKDLENDSLHPEANVEETNSDERFAKNILQIPKNVNTKAPGHHLKTSASYNDNERHFLDETNVNKSSQSTSNPEIAQVLNAAADTIKKAFRSFIDQKDEILADKQATSAKDKENPDRKTSMTIVETNNMLEDNVNNKTRWYVGDDPIIPTIDQEASESLEIELPLFDKPAPIDQLEKLEINLQSGVSQAEEVDQTIKTADTVADISSIPHEKVEKSFGLLQEIQLTKSEADGNIATEIEKLPISSTSTEESKEISNVDNIQSARTDIDVAENVQQLQKPELSDTVDESPQLEEALKSSELDETQGLDYVEKSPNTSPSKSAQAKSSSENTNIVAIEESNEAYESAPPVVEPNENENAHKHISQTSHQESMLDSVEPPIAVLAFASEFTSETNDDVQEASQETNSAKHPIDLDQRANAKKAQDTILSVENNQYITSEKATIPAEFLDDVKSSSGVSSSEELPTAMPERQHEVNEVTETAVPTNEHPPELTQTLSIDSESSPRTDVENLDISVYGEDSLEAMYYSLKKHELLLDKMHKQASVCKSASSERPVPANVDLESCSQEVSGDKSDSDAQTKQIKTDANDKVAKHEDNAENKNLPKKKVSRNESYETACALRPITSATVNVREITSAENVAPELGLRDGTEYSRERKLSRNESYETACTTRPITSASISPRTQRELDAENPINLAKHRTEQFIQQLHTTPSYNESLDEITIEEIRRNVLAYSISEADSDYCEAAERTNAVFNDFNISTALENTPSTDTDSTIISAVTKIQAGARGFLTRRRLRRASVATTSFSDRRPSFGNDAISESLEDLIEEQDAARRIQKSFRRYRSRKTRQSAPSLRNNLTNESSSKSWNDSSGENAPMIIDVKLGQKQSTKKDNSNGSTSDEETIGKISNFVGRIGEKSVENDSGLKKDEPSISFEGVNLAARRMTLQRGDAVQRNSTGEDENVSVSRSGSDNQDEKDESLSKKLPRSKSSGTERCLNKPERSNNIDRAKRFGPRQKTMPVQIDFEILRVLPRHLRRRIRSADQQNKTKSDS